MTFQHLEVERDGHVAILWLNRPEKLNAMSADMWEDIPAAMAPLDADPGVRVVVVAGRGPAFTVGIDVGMLASMGDGTPTPDGIYATVRRLQHTFSCLADSPMPVIAAVHGYCLGAGINLASACDLRLASADAVFSIRETRMGLVADVGVLQRLPAVVGRATTAEMAFTGGDYDAQWALRRGLVSQVIDDRDGLMGAALQLAGEIAANSPLVTKGIKRVLEANVGRTTEEALDFVARWNSEHLISRDLYEAIAAYFEKRPPVFTGE
jgi:enoyl-CoA hydratase